MMDTLQIIARSVSVAEAPTRILVVPAGTVQTQKGSFVMDAAAARDLIADLSATSVDLPIDYEHQTMGGEYASPTGQAPASGWMKSFRWVEGEGLYAEVEWTEAGRERLAAKEYRYLSPVVIIRKTDRRVMALHSAALTNKPAIVGMPALVNKDVTADDADNADDRPGGPAVDASATRKECAMRDQLIGVLALKADASEEMVLGAVRQQREELALLKGIENRMMVVCKAAGVEAGLPAEKIEARLLALKMDADRYHELQPKHEAMLKAHQDAEVQQIIAKHVDEGRLVPSDVEKATQLILRDREFFDEWIKTAPIKAPPGKTNAPPAGTKAETDRAAIIAKAGKEWDDNSELQILCDRRAAINGELIAAKLDMLRDDEAN